MAASKDEQTVYEFKVSLQYIKPPIWRRIQVPDDYTFFDLHVAIQDIFQWSGDHLHKFEMAKPKRDLFAMLMTDDFELDEYIGIPERSEPYYKILSEKETRIRDQFVLNDAYKKKCLYVYDFGSEWRHDILLERIMPALSNVVYPRDVPLVDDNHHLNMSQMIQTSRLPMNRRSLKTKLHFVIRMMCGSTIRSNLSDLF